MAIIIGRTSRVGEDFTLAARPYVVSTAVAVAAGGAGNTNSFDPVYPNPFNRSVVLPFRLGRTAEVELAIYNALGQREALVVAEQLGAGNYRARWDGHRAASGAYLAVLKVDGKIGMRRLTLVK